MKRRNWSWLGVVEHLILSLKEGGEREGSVPRCIPVPSFILLPMRNVMPAPGQAAFAGASMEPGLRDAYLPR